MDKEVFRVWMDKRLIILKKGLTQSVSASIENTLGRMPVKKIGKDPLYLIIAGSGDGGDFPATLRLYDALQKCGSKIITIAYGKASSSGLTLFQSGAVRMMTRKSLLQFHQANFNFIKGETLNTVQLQEVQRKLMRIDGIQIKIYSQRTGLGYNALEKLLNKESWINAKEAKKMNLADCIIPEPKNIEELLRFLKIKF